VNVREEPFAEFDRHLAVPSTVESDSVFDVVEPYGALTLVERPLLQPFHKDYDAVENPRTWLTVLDVGQCALFGAYVGSTRVGGAIGVFNSPTLHLTEGRSDLAVLWDLRVAPSSRRAGAGSALFQAVQDWALERQCRELRVETQNTNVPACRFYLSRGCHLHEAKRGAYPLFPQEIQLIWCRSLRPRGARGVGLR
jgi:GNAT superfamily N-acetyltransferase